MPLQSRPYTPQLVNAGHPLTRGLVTWWLPVPGLAGGPVLWDLVGTSHGVFNGMGATTRGWRSTIRRGGFNSILFDGTNTAFVGSTNTNTKWNVGTGDFAVAAWVRLNNTITFGTLFNLDDGTTGNGIIMYTGSPNGGMRCWVANQVRNTTTTTTDGKWHHFLATRISGTVFQYVDGTPDGSFASAGSVTANQHLRTGASFSGGGSLPLPGYSDDIRFYNRGLSAAEVQELYDNSLQGYPGLLNQGKVAVQLSFDGSYAKDGGSAVVTTSYAVVVNAAGELAAGSGTTLVNLNPSVTAAGQLASGSAVSSCRYTPSISAAGVLAAGAATSTATYRPAVTGLNTLAAGSGTVVAIYLDIVAAGVLAAGRASRAVVLAYIVSGGAVLRGIATQTIRPFFGPKHAFNVGDIVYVQTSIGSYVQQRVQGLIISGSRVCYRVSLGGVPPEKVLSFAQYHAVLCQTEAAAQHLPPPPRPSCR